MANQTNGFLPDGYKTPSSNSGYTTIQEGDNTIRILSKPIIFWEDWINNKPVRFEIENKPKVVHNKYGILHCWAMIVYNYNTENIEVYELSQMTIKNAIENYNKNVKWGNPFTYDLVITKTTTGDKTKYSIIANPKEPVSEQIKQAYKDKPINLKALMTSGNPFEKNGIMYEQKEVEQEIIEVINEINEDESEPLPF